MSDETIPEDVMKSARDLWFVSLGFMVDRHGSAQILARAIQGFILAERERCAQLVDGAAANSDNCRGARDEWGNEDGARDYRVNFWGDLAASLLRRLPQNAGRNTTPKGRKVNRNN